MILLQDKDEVGPPHPKVQAGEKHARETTGECQNQSEIPKQEAAGSAEA